MPEIDICSTFKTMSLVHFEVELLTPTFWMQEKAWSQKLGSFSKVTQMQNGSVRI